MAEFHGLDLPLAALIAVLVIKEGAGLVRHLVGRLNGAAPDTNGHVTRADLLEAKGELLVAMRVGQDQLHARITEINVRLARVEGGGGGRT